MAQKQDALSINLAKNSGETFFDRFLAWALTIGRLLIIITESLALGAFLYRFSLDRQLVDLHDRIAQEQAVVKLLSSNETTYRALQDRLALIKTIETTSSTQVKIFQDILSFAPQDMTIKSLAFTTSGAQIDGEVGSVLSLNSFINQLKSYPQVTSVNLNKLQNQQATSTLIISITVTFKQTAQPL